MLNLNVTLAGGAALLLLAGCAEQLEMIDVRDNYDAAQAAEPTGSAFERNLHAGYLELASGERAEYDWRDSAHFSDKALAAAGGAAVAPDEIGDRDLPADSIDTLSAARGNLTAALAGGAAARAPSAAARAQVSFDCWMQEQEENIQPEDIAACRDAFNAAMAALGQAEGYVVHFGLDSTKLSQKAQDTIMAAAAAAKANSAAKVLVNGHADLTGDGGYNLAISEKRAAAVTQMLLSAGVKAEQIQSASFGDAQPVVSTKSAERKNRRVEINLVQ